MDYPFLFGPVQILGPVIYVRWMMIYVKVNNLSDRLVRDESRFNGGKNEDHP